VPGGEIPGLDKVAHVLVFALPTFALLAAGARRRLVVGVMLIQALASEFVQGALLPHRSGDVLDALADAVGIGVALIADALVRRPRS